MTDRKFLLIHPFQNPLTLRRIIALRLYLLNQRSGLLFITIPVFGQLLDQLIIGGKETTDHDKNQPSVVTDVLPFVERIHQMSHHFTLS